MDLQNNRFSVSFPKKGDDCFEQDWNDFSRIAIAAYMEDSWFIKVHPHALDRRDYLEKYVNDLYENYILKDEAIFGVLKIKGSKYSVIGGGCFKKLTTVPLIEHPQNMDEIRLNYMYKRIYAPLKTVADKYRTQLWEGTLVMMEPALAKVKIGRVLSTQEVKIQVLTEFSKKIKMTPMPFVFSVTMHTQIKDSVTQRNFGHIGSVTYNDEAFGEVTDHIIARKLPGTSKMHEEAKSLFISSKL